MVSERQDVLLECLLFMSQHYGMANTREALVAGLPLVNGMLTQGERMSV